MKEPNRNRHSNTDIIIRVVGTSPLSFEVTAGAILQVREIGPSSASRPTVGGRFKSSAFLLFNDKTKVGRLSPASLKTLGQAVPRECKVAEVDKERRVLRVMFS